MFHLAVFFFVFLGFFGYIFLEATTHSVLKHQQGRAPAEPGGPWRLTFALGRLENLRFFIQITCRAPWILQFQSTGLPSYF